MNTLRKFLVTCFGLSLGIVITVLVMINGWGLEPKSWWWIIGAGFFGHLFAIIIAQIGITSDK